jgi:hypothetical protein
LNKIELGNEYDSNKIGKIAYARLEEVMIVNSSLTIINSVTTQAEYELQKELDYWNR